ncbi:MAG: hypothetical protein ACRDT4_10850 [Micromonosporaceae bacterium]
MTSQPTTTEPATDAAPPARSGRRTDLGVCLGYLALAGWLTYGLWLDPAGHVLALNWQDQTLNEWFLAHGLLPWQGDGMLVTDRLNAPDGVNLMANASLLLYGLLLAPVTALFGAPVSFALLVTLALGGTAIGWYLLLSRRSGVGPLAAAVGGGFCGFAPGMVSQANGHPHIAAQFGVPLLIFLVLRLLDGARPVRDGALLAGVVCLQLFGGEEVLFLTAVSCALFVGWYAVLDRPEAARRLPRALLGLATTTGVAVLVLAYPLWVQFAGPGSVPNGVFSGAFFSADVMSFVTYPGLSLAGDMATASRVTTGASEHNAFYGWPLLLVVVAGCAWLWRRTEVKALALTGLVLALLALGPEITVAGEPTGVPGPWALIGHLPVVDSALPMRYTLPLIPIFGILLALGVDRARSLPGRGQVAVAIALGVALLPLFPTPMPVRDRAPVPEFITSGQWRTCVRPGGTLVPVPLPSSPEPTAMGWAAAAGDEFALPQGFFIGPYAAGGEASVGTYSQPTAALLDQVVVSGTVPTVGPAERHQAAADLEFWRADCVVIADDTPQADALRTTVAELLERPGRHVGGVWMWDVTPR